MKTHRGWSAFAARAQKTGVVGLVGLIAGFFGIIQFFEFIYEKYILGEFGLDSFAWAATTATAIVVIIVLVVFCGLSHHILLEELDRKAAVVRERDEQILSKRLTSSKGKRKRRGKR